MGLFDSSSKPIRKVQSQPPVQQTVPLTASEIELILRLLSTTNFPVKDIEVLYTALIKLQEQFKILINDKNES